MDKRRSIAWIRTALFAALGGGIAGTVAGMSDTTKYHIPQDVFSGKLWPQFFVGAAMTFGAMLMKSPLGQSALQAYKDAQQQAKEDADLLDKVKQDIISGAKAEPPPAGKPQPPPEPK